MILYFIYLYIHVGPPDQRQTSRILPITYLICYPNLLSSDAPVNFESSSDKQCVVVFNLQNSVKDLTTKIINNFKAETKKHDSPEINKNNIVYIISQNNCINSIRSVY